jgi:hypothetical protein
MLLPLRYAVGQCIHLFWQKNIHLLNINVFWDVIPSQLVKWLLTFQRIIVPSSFKIKAVRLNIQVFWDINIVSLGK